MLSDRYYIYPDKQNQKLKKIYLKNSLQTLAESACIRDSQTYFG